MFFNNLDFTMGNCCPQSPSKVYEPIPDRKEDTPKNTSQNRSSRETEVVNITYETRSNATSNTMNSHVVKHVDIPIRSEHIPIGMPNQAGGAPSTPSGLVSKSAFYLKYELRDEIGVGSTSKCYKCMRKSDGKFFACKVIDKRQVEMKFSGLLDQFFVEIKVLKSLHHPNIIHLEETFESPDRIYMVMELMMGGELFDYVVEKGTLSEEEASVIVRKITSAVAYMHNMNIIHRDLKPENLLLTTQGTDAEVKLIDFGLAKIMRESVASSFLGTKGYLAPEMLQRQSYDKSIDMWSLGVIVFVLLCGCLPFDDDSSKIANESVARKKFALRFPKWASNLSPSAKDLLHNLLEINPKERYTADQALNHPWVSGRTVVPSSYLQSPCVLGKNIIIIFI